MGIFSEHFPIIEADYLLNDVNFAISSRVAFSRKAEMLGDTII